MTEALTSNYWISPNAVRITLNAMGRKDYIQCGATGGAVIMCYIRDVDGLGYDAGHNYRRWPIVTAPVYFNSWTRKYVYIAIPRSTAVGTSAILVFPSKHIDLYGMTEPAEGETEGEQIGSKDYYYIFLRGVISPSRSDDDADQLREWEEYVDYGTLSTDQQISEGDSEWWRYNADDDTVTFLKVITNATFKVLNVLKSLIVGGDASIGKNLSVGGTLDVKGQATIDNIKSHNYTGDGLADTGWSLTNSYNGHSKLTIDEIYVRMKAVFESLEVRERTYTGGDQIWSCAGNYVHRTDYMTDTPKTVWVEADGTERTDEAETEEEKAAAARRAQDIMDEEGIDLYEVPVAGNTVGYSMVKVPWLLKGIAMVLGKNNGLVRGLFAHHKKVRITMRRSPAHGGSGDESDEQVLATVRRVRCYFLAKDNERQVHNWWRINDLARCQTMNLENIVRETYLESATSKTGNVFWWRKVIGVSTNPVRLEDGKWYHYFDVAFNSKIEESTDPSIHASMATFAMEGSDIPAAGDSVVQFGNTIIEGRMNLMMMEVNGGDSIGYSPSTDAPCLKAYRGVYCFDLNKCWVGGSPCKMKLSPSTGYEFYGPNIKFVTEYAIVPVPIERPEIYWTNIGRRKDAMGNWIDSWTFEEDAYNRAEPTPYSDDAKTHRDYSSFINPDGSVRAGAPVRKCYYYEKVSHNGCYFICSIVDGSHWEAEETFSFNGVTYPANRWINDGTYNSFSAECQGKCKRVPNYTIEEPSAESQDWTMTVNRGSEPIAVYKWAQEGTSISAPTINKAQWAAWTDGSQPIDGWTKTAPNRPTQNPETWYLFMSQNTLYADGSISTWSTPTRISGSQGTPGEDAGDTEWIYLINNSSVNPGAPNNITNGTIPDPNNPGQRIPSTDKTKDDWVPNGWTDNPDGIAWNQQYEWASFRTKAKGANVDPNIRWSDFSVPIIWSHWGQNGMDGDGVEYVYMRTKNNVAPIVVYNDNINRTAHGKTYLDDEYLPVINNNDATKSDATKAWAESNECTDDPKGISRDWPYEWCLKRVMTPANAETGKRTWRCYGGTAAGQTQEMDLWNHYAENAIRLDLDGEMNMVQTDSAGHVTTPRTVSVITRIYDGASPATTGVTVVSTPAQLAIAGVTPTFTPASGVAADGTLTVSWTFGTDRVLSSASDVDIILRFMNEDYRGKFTVAPSQGSPVYQLKMSQSALTCPRSVEDNTLGAPPALSLSIVRIDGANTDEMSILSSDGVMEDGDEVLKIRYDLAQMPSAATGGLAWPSANSVQAANTDNNVFVAIFNTAGRLLDRETVPVIKEGAHGDGVDNLIRKYQISASGKAGTGRKYPADIQTWLDDSPAVTEEKPYLWLQLTTDYKYKADTVEYYCVGKKGENGIDAKDAEWVYVRTQEKVAPEVPSSGSYAEVATGDHPYTEDDHKPYVRVPKAKSIKGDGDSEGTVSGDYKYVKCTDDPQGVDETWKYEWELKRTKGNPDANGHRSWNPYSGPMVLRNSIGASPWVADLDNEMNSVACDADGKPVQVGGCNQSVSTNFKLFYGSTAEDFYVSSVPVARDGVTIMATPATSSTAAKTGSLTVTYEGDPTKTRAIINGKDEFTVTLTSKKDNTVTRDLTLIINGIKPGPDGKTPSIYNLLPSVSEIVVGRTGESSDIEFVPTQVATDMWDDFIINSNTANG